MRKIFLLFFFFGCEKEIEMQLPKYNDSLVVEGFIQPDLPCYVILSKTQGIFDANPD